MKKPTDSIFSHFYCYQKQRFPIVILIISLFPAILSSNAVVSVHSNILKILMAFIACFAYLLHIRISDEKRDFHHDNIHHLDRPIQTGIISEKELEKFDIIAILVVFGVAIFSGTYAGILAIFMLLYSYVARKDFFWGEKIRKYFFFYNAVNLVQMLLMQLFVYAIFAGFFQFNKLILFHFAFTATGTIIFEFMRKLKIPDEDGSGKDTYTSYLGFKKSMIIYILLALLNAFLFFKISYLITNLTNIWILFSSLFVINLLVNAAIHWYKKTSVTNKFSQASFLVAYGFFNIIIYILRT